ncbi:23S rRNA m(2)G2445 methyltransferase [Segniliparus rotundus DSM 44985]|uniref:23S rRNA m(2)G2445 methyltransferase n=1 Tax=Segniliparus rotundus (strain ATCC BAA-972 / CDC 1076 / CIP 108378 / DSM 44985 / JCM 13578) TaxID=640132 RepID=D6Z9K8_SEGRD|nr:hypothetical protein [Segniliparus rotundus]ADG96535.1 23S rRNA m(2)G2445 methyltransferase [Segniliparus rotundus DSM 44985]
MSGNPIATTRYTVLSGPGSGPTLGELRELVAKTHDWAADSRVLIARSRIDQDDESWHMALLREAGK